MNRKPIIKRHGTFKLGDMKSGKLFIKGKDMNFRVVKSLGKRYLVLDNEAISFSNFNELWNELKQRGTNLLIAYDKTGKNYATILL
ncbi:MAG: hypothetical protein JHC26_01945 [Thermofilum sp.]|jgi:hypothetical protein|uniref:hypothetical protein n=1 Tax=Thermofilum sp. TaxID=1961369 RepID=UPI0025893B43|nr:hypothetical protein [Thermofilum sp.]MCI4407825.1 hypothetical protein [Thermofilum sp.]